MTPQAGATLTFSLQEVHEVSVGLLQFLDENDISGGVGMAALAMSLARLMGGPAPLSDDAEVNFIKGVIEWGGMFFSEGGMN